MLPALPGRGTALLGGTLPGPSFTEQVRAYLNRESMNQSIPSAERRPGRWGCRCAPWPVEQVAELLGYSEWRAFLRAFKRWFGRSPKELRDAGLAARRRD